MAVKAIRPPSGENRKALMPPSWEVSCSASPPSGRMTYTCGPSPRSAMKPSRDPSGDHCCPVLLPGSVRVSWKGSPFPTTSQISWSKRLASQSVVVTENAIMLPSGEIRGLPTDSSAIWARKDSRTGDWDWGWAAADGAAMVANSAAESTVLSAGVAAGVSAVETKGRMTSSR